MNTPEGGRAPAARAEEDAEARAEALAALRVAAGLRLPAANWAEARRAVEAVNAALHAADTDALRDATGELELIEPARLRTGVADGGEADDGGAGDGEAGAAPASAELRELLNRTVHALTAEAGAADGTGAGPDAGARD